VRPSPWPRAPPADSCPPRGEAGAAGPSNPYGDPAGHTWLAIDGPRSASRNILTGIDDRSENMLAFTAAALTLFTEVLAAT
jgi:nicotinamide-nucleotide amidase